MALKQGPDEGKGVADLAGNSWDGQSKRSVWGRMLDNVYSLFGSKNEGEPKPVEEIKVTRNNAATDGTAANQAPKTKVSKTPEEIASGLDPMIKLAREGRIKEAFDFYSKYLGDNGIPRMMLGAGMEEERPFIEVVMSKLQLPAVSSKGKTVWDYLIYLRDMTTIERMKETKSLEVRIMGGLNESKYVLMFYGDKAYLLASGFSYHSMEVNCLKRTLDSAREADNVHVAWGGKIKIEADKVTLYDGSTAYGGPSDNLLRAMAPAIKASFKLPVVGRTFHEALNQS
jgi:hypothetical protein